ncbi:MAG: DUF3791 domain-containing protein [Nitrososphaerota archaeon]|nr:DUF3791 domain-containing protein [Nitrososphaerota archaeon]
MSTTAENKTYKILSYIVLCIKKFAEAFNLSLTDAYRYLGNYGGLQFIIDHYEIEHTLSIDEAIEDMQTICRKNGGLI